MELNKEERAIRDALSQIETPAYDMEGAVRQSMTAKAPARRSSPFPRTALLAAALAALLVVGAAAVGISGLWARFFPNPVPQNAVTSIGVSQTSGEYTLTLEDAMVDERAVILLMSLRRADGKPIDPEAHLYTNSMHVEILADGESFMGGGGFEDEFLSEDGKTRYFSYAIENFDTSELQSLLDKELTFTAEGVAVQIRMPDGFYHYKPTETVDLSPLAEKEVADLSGLGEHWARENTTSDPLISAALAVMDISLPLPLNSEFPQYAVRGVVTTPNGLGFALTQAKGRNGDRACTGVYVEALIDTRDGKRYDTHSGHQVILDNGDKVFLTTFRDCPLTAADLPYLRLEVSYAIDRILSEEPFSLTFTPDSGTSCTVPLDSAVNENGVNIHLTKLRFSALGLSLTMEGVDPYSYPFTSDGSGPVITLKDGSTIQTYRWSSSDPDYESSITDFRFYSVGDDWAFLDTTQVASVTLNGVTLWTSGNYILNVENAMADNDGVILLLSLRRTDGGPVDPDASLRSNTIGCDLLVDGKSIGGGFQPSVLSEDGKTLYLCTESRTNGSFESIAGKTLTFKTGGVGISILAPEAFPDRDMTVSLSQPLPLAEEFPSLRYVGAEATDEGFAVTTTLGRDIYGEFTSIKASPITLTDSRDGKEYRSAQGKYITLPDGTPAYRALYQSCPLTEADIPYLKATYGYTMDRVLSVAPMSFSFTLSNGSGRLFPMNQTVTVSGFDVHLTELRFSSIGLSLNMSSGTDACNALTEVGAGPVLTMKDGSKAETYFRGSGSNPDGPSSISFTFVNQKDERVFPDVSQIASISLGGAIIWQAS